ncbi:hypothetical protein NSP_29230 [Nodularia spumigena CCY9414]|nr:hypothetical protein NSP_29230 [Nodularia spumigena CCY9414]
MLDSHGAQPYFNGEDKRQGRRVQGAGGRKRQGSRELSSRGKRF